MKKIVLPVASSGIAALLLPRGRTAKSRFKLPLNLEEHVMCDIRAGFMLASLIKKIDLIIWDEAPMTHHIAFEALHKTMRDILSQDDPQAVTKLFGGKIVLLGSNIRQILPVITGRSEQDTILASINRSYLWDYCNFYSLGGKGKIFAQWIIEVGNGTKKKMYPKDTYNEVDDIEINEQLIMRNGENNIERLGEDVYPEFQKKFNNREFIKERAILTPKNETVDELNMFLMDKLPGEQRNI